MGETGGLMNNSDKAWWKPIVHFATHTAVGTVIFVVIALPAFGLGQLVHWLTSHGSSDYVIGVLTLLEYAIVTFDAMLLLWHVATTGIAAMKETDL
jgi:hypothetical protein